MERFNFRWLITLFLLIFAQPVQTAAQSGPSALCVAGQGSFDAGNYSQARASWEQAAAQGDACAMGYLGNLYAEGIGGVQKDEKRAAAYFGAAAQRGNAVALSNLGRAYCLGAGVLPDIVKGQRLLEFARDHGVTDSSRVLKELAALGLILPPGAYPLANQRAPQRGPDKPSPDWEWRGQPGSKPGDSDGAWFNPKTQESLRADLNHPPGVDPHWDYRAPGRGSEYWWYLDGRLQLKRKSEGS
jgi:hypothetical protein